MNITENWEKSKNYKEENKNYHLGCIEIDVKHFPVFPFLYF